MVKNASANARIKISPIKLRGIAINARITAMIAVVKRLVINARQATFNIQITLIQTKSDASKIAREAKLKTLRIKFVMTVEIMGNAGLMKNAFLLHVLISTMKTPFIKTACVAMKILSNTLGKSPLNARYVNQDFILKHHQVRR